VTASAQAQDRWLPLFLPSEITGKPDQAPEVQNTSIQEVRILVFPHLGTYSVPQGAEKSPGEVTLSSTGTCTLTPGSAAAKSFRFVASELNGPQWVDCAGAPVTVVREAALRSFSYSGRFLVRPAQSPQGQPIVQVINVLPFEDYLKGVVPTEVPASWPQEALKTQAIAARTYAVFEISNARAQGKDPEMDIDDTVASQAYLGLSKATPQTDRAVEQTERMIVTYQGKAIKAYFSADSGGYTEAAENVWGGALPYCVSKPEVYPADAFPTAWNTSLTEEALSDKLRARGLLAAGQTVRRLEVRDSERFVSGRASRVIVTTWQGDTFPISAFAFRLAVGLRSTMFSVTRQDRDSPFVFAGRGWGHGVGMSQYGTQALVQKLGWSAEKILPFYYEGTQLSRLPETRP
jgi:stage II sporulation protein D